MSESLFDNLGKAWERFRYGDDGATDGDAGDSAQPIQSTASIAHVVAIPSAPTVTVSEAFKAALIESVAKSVPKLQELLENAALIADEVSDPGARMRIVLKSARLSPSDLAEMLAQTDAAVASVIQQVMGEVANEERDKVTVPSERLESLRATKQAKEAELASLSEQIGQAELSLSQAKQKVAEGREKSQAGANLLESWSAEMKKLLSINK